MSICKRGFIFTVLLLLLCSGLVADTNDKKITTISASVGDMELVYNGRTGISLSVIGTSFINTSTFAIVNTEWTVKHLATIAEPYIYDYKIEPYKGGKKVTVFHRSSTDPLHLVEGQQVFIMLPNNTFTIIYDLEYKGDEPAVFEGQIGGINPFPIAGQEFIANKGGEQIQGIIPIEAKSSDVEESTVVKGFDSLRLKTRMGNVEIRSHVEDNMSLFDYRKNTWAEKNNPMFWFGYLSRPVVDGKIYYKSTIKFPMKPFWASKSKTDKKITCSSIPDAKMSKWQQDFIMPTPKKIERSPERFNLNSDTTIYVGKEGTKVLDNAIAFFLDDLKEYFGKSIEVKKEEAPTGAVNAIILGDKDRYSTPALLCEQAGVKLPEHEEGYCLLSNKDNVLIAANTEQGLFYGITTLLQLAYFEDSELSFKGAKIEDYPALRYRGIHSLSGKKAGDQIAKAVKNLMARYKINKYLMQMEYVNWETKGQAQHPSYGMDKEDARKAIIAADDNNVEFIPFISSLGHMEWMFLDKYHLELAEDPEFAYAYCPTNPKTYEFIFKLYEEVIDLCVNKPKTFHIGHDEVTIVGRFPYRSAKLGKTASDLVIEDIAKVHKWFKDKGIEMAVWGDMFIHISEASTSAHAPSVEEAEKRRAGLPKDVAVYDWHYEVNPPEKFTSLKLFKDQGRKVIACSWSAPENIANLAKACVNYDLEGILQTVWAGFNFGIDWNYGSWHQYWAYLLAAQYSWTGENIPESELDFCAPQLFYDIWMETRPVMEDKKGCQFDLSSVYNRSLTDNENGAGWLGYGSSRDLSEFPTGQIVLGDDRFLVKESDEGSSALLMSGNLNPKGRFPANVNLKLDGIHASEINFLFTAAFTAKDETEIGNIEVKFSDGTSTTIPLVYGRNILSFTDIRVGPKAQIAWIGKTKAGTEICVNKYSWKNETLNKEIVGISINSKQSDSSIILLAITSVE